MAETERFLIEALTKLLGPDDKTLGPATNFSEIGLDSITGLRFCREIGERIGEEAEFEWLYDYPSVRELAKFLNDNFQTSEIYCRNESDGQQQATCPAETTAPD